MHTDDSLKAIALANSDQASDRCLAKRNQWAAMLSPNYFLIFDILIKNSEIWLISRIHQEFSNKNC